MSIYVFKKIFQIIKRLYARDIIEFDYIEDVRLLEILVNKTYNSLFPSVYGTLL